MGHLGMRLLERDLLPDPLIRWGIRRLLRQRLREESADPQRRRAELVAALDAGPIALHVDTANEQHYEVPTAFFRHVLGRHMKYSGGYWPAGVDTLDASEESMLALSAERAGLEDGQDVLELGCGWGSMTLYVATRFPGSRIVGVSNSSTQREHILAEAADRGLGNVEIVTADMNDFDVDRHVEAGRRFDRVVSVEMLEHMRNYRALFRRIAGWMKDDARFFVHVFCHRTLAYPFEVRDESDWMARYFFTGGLMPSFDLFRAFFDDLVVEEDWKVPGTHYQATSEAWLRNLDAHRDAVWPLLEETYGADQALRWWVYWRVFFLSCAELFGFAGGEEWLVGHYRLRKTGR